MKLKDYAILIGINAVITGLIVSFVISNQGRDKSAVLAQDADQWFDLREMPGNDLRFFS